jgi:hypothetical protein
MGAKGENVMKLSVLERLLCQGLLPQEASFANLKLMRKAREALSFTEEELSVLNLQDNGDGKVTWEDGVVPETEIKLGVTPVKAIIASLKDLDKAEQLKQDHMSVYEKFVEGDPVKEIEASGKVTPIDKEDSSKE